MNQSVNSIGSTCIGCVDNHSRRSGCPHGSADTCGQRRDVLLPIWAGCKNWRVVLDDFGYSPCVQRRTVPQEVFG